MILLKHKPIITAYGAIAIKGIVQCWIVHNGIILKEFPPQPNLILNQGMDYPATYPFVTLFAYAVAGSGTTATSVNSGAATASVAGTTLTISTIGYLNGDASDNGRTFKFSSGEIRRVTAFSSTTQCTVDISGAVAATTFDLYNTNQAGLVAELKRTNTYLTGASNCNTTYAGAVRSCFRTFDFAAEIGNVTYNEIGFSPLAATGANLAIRIKLASPISLVAGNQLRVKYTQIMTFAPSTPQTVGTSPISGWATATGAQQWEFDGLRTIATNGNIAGRHICEPSSGIDSLFICTNATALQTFNNGYIRNNPAEFVVGNLNSYAAFDWFRTKTGTFATGAANGTNWNSYGICESSIDVSGFTYLFDTPQTKDSLHTLTLAFRLDWSRVLS
jgi:hypothetical protein